MGIFSNLEQRLADGVNSAFAKAFRSEVQPVELASAVRNAMDERAARIDRGKRAVVPNLFHVELSATDYERLTAHEADLADELRASATEHAETQRYVPGGPVSLEFECNDKLETGVFRVRPEIARQVQPERKAPRYGQYKADENEDQHPAQYADQDSPTVLPEPQDAQPQDAPAPPAPQERQETHPAAPAHPQPQEGAHRFALPQGRRAAGSDVHHAETSEARMPAPSPVAPAPPQEFAAADPAPAPRPEPERPRRESNPYEPNRPSPAAPRSVRQRPWLELDGNRYPLIGAITVLGRDDDADIILDDPGVSRRHAEVRVTTDGPHLVVTLRDLESTNGTFLDGNRVSRQHLTGGERITIGRTSFLFHRGGER